MLLLSFGVGNLHGLLLEPVAEFVVDFSDDFFAGLGEVSKRFGGFVDQDKGGGGADAHTVEQLAFEAGLLDQPGSVDFVTLLVLMDGETFIGDALGLFFGHVDVFEKGTRTGLHERVGEFAGANLADDVADAHRGEIGEAMVGNIALDGVVKRAGHLTLMKLQSDSDNEVAAALGGV